MSQTDIIRDTGTDSNIHTQIQATGQIDHTHIHNTQMEDTGREVAISNLNLHFAKLTQEKVSVSFINASLIY